MAVAFRFTFSDGPGANALSRLAEASSDLRPALRALGRAAVVQTKKRFMTKRAPNGSTWKPSGSPRGTLVRMGYLRDHIHARLHGATAVEVGSPEAYSAVHQFGATIRAKGRAPLRFRVGANGSWVAKREVTIPARPYLGINAADEAEFVAILERHLSAALEGRSPS